MSILSDLYDGAKGFYNDYKDVIKPVVGAGLGALNQSNADNTQSQYLAYLKQKELENYQNSVNQITAYNSQLGASGGGGGRRSGGGGGNGAAVAAANATEKNRQAALKKANKLTQNTYKELLKMYAPYRQTADQLLPQMTQTYENSLGLQNSLASFVSSPAQVAKLNAAGPAWNVNVPLPDSVRLK